MRKTILSTACAVTAVLAQAANPPLYAAADTGNKAEVERLLKSGADPNTVGEKETSALQAAAYRGNVDIAKLLLVKGANVNHKNALGTTPLMNAISGGEERSDRNRLMIKALLDSGSNVNLDGVLGMTPVHTAARSLGDDVETFDLILSKNGDLNAKMHGNATVLMLAVSAKNRKIVKSILARHPSSLNDRNASGQTALSMAIALKDREVESVLRAAGAR
jgi:ankyrin repeat protein